MTLLDLALKVSNSYQSIKDEDRVTIFHFFRDDFGLYDISPPLTFPCGMRATDLKDALKPLGTHEDLDGVVCVMDAWTYPESVAKELGNMTDEQRQEYYNKTPPSEHPERVSLSSTLAVAKNGEGVLVGQTRDGRVTTHVESDSDKIGGVQVEALRFILGIS